VLALPWRKEPRPSMNFGDDHVPIATLLRRARVLAFRLRHEPLKQWIKSELDGYSGDAELPDYRFLHLPSRGDVRTPFEMVSNIGLPMFNLPDDLRKMATEVRVTNSIREIERMSKEEEGKHFWPPEVVMLAHKYLPLRGTLIEAWNPLPTYLLEGILDAVRNRLQEFALELDTVQPGVLADFDLAAGIAAARVEQVFNMTIHGGSNTIAAGNVVTQQVGSQVITGDMASLEKELQKLGVPLPEIEELREAIETDDQPEAKEFGPKVQNWLGKAITKMAQGSWKTVTDAAPKLIVKALIHYLGLG
jgi:hypothetical protein